MWYRTIILSETSEHWEIDLPIETLPVELVNPN
jgi:hypothetical protein